jgi:DNA mismatch endonuclease Vsr
MRMTRLPNVDPARSTQMALVRSRDTKPELVVRHIAHALGYRYRLYRRDLPGTPDLVFPGRHKVISCMVASGTRTGILPAGAQGSRKRDAIFGLRS